MGYCMQMQNAKFFVQSENVGKFLFHMSALPYEYSFDIQGNITGIKFKGMMLGNEDKVFPKAAPYVKDGSFLEMTGEGNERWRWCFSNSKCTTQKARLIY